MLTGIGLRNFKAFGDEMQEAPLSKITLIYGPNSGGKSSIIQALLLLKQSLSNSYTDNPRMLMPRGVFADLGSFRSLIHKHEEERELGIGVSYNVHTTSDKIAENTIEMAFSDSKGSAELSEVSFQISYRDRLLLDSVLNRSPNRDIDLGQETYYYPDVQSWTGKLSVANVYENHPIGWLHILNPSLTENFLPRLALSEMRNLREEEIRRQGRSRSVRLRRAVRWAETLESDVQDEITSYIDEMELPDMVEWIESVNPRWDEWDIRAAATDVIHQSVESFTLPRQVDTMELYGSQIQALAPENIVEDYERQLRLVDYIGPLRSAPERLYRLSSVESDSIGIQGEFSANVLYRNNRIKKRVNFWFNRRRLDIPYELDVIRLGDAELSGEHITIALYDKRTKTQVTLADVGYGINQLLPVIIEGIASKEGSIICVEQPEIHLHPRLQANIADLMIDTIANERGKRKQWIVETHSELLITRIQRRIREGKIKSEDISVLYVDPSDDNGVEGSAILRLEMDENGDFIDHWPHGFFDEAFNELMTEPEQQMRPAD